jgi:iron complex transport system substrate-binding protein
MRRRGVPDGDRQGNRDNKGIGRMKRPWLLTVLCAVILITTGCGKKNSEIKDAGTTADTLVDAAGRTVIIPPVVGRVVSPFAMYTRLIVAMGGCDQLVGVSHTCVLPEEMRGCGSTLTKLPDVGQFGANIELIASLQPDIIFVSQSDIATFSSKTNAIVVSTSFPHEVPMLEMFNRQIDLIGKTMHLERNGDSLKQFIHDVLEPVVSVTASIPDSVRPKAYFAWTTWTGTILNTVTEFDPIELAGGINVARDANNFTKGERGIIVSREHIIKWNPDVIFVSRYQKQEWHKDGSTKPMPVTTGDVIADPLLQSIEAIKNKRVYYTTAFCNWWPQQRALAQVLYMAKLFYPDRFADLDVEGECNRIFKRFYGEDNLYTEMANDLELHSWK